MANLHVDIYLALQKYHIGIICYQFVFLIQIGINLIFTTNWVSKLLSTVGIPINFIFTTNRDSKLVSLLVLRLGNEMLLPIRYQLYFYYQLGFQTGIYCWHSGWVHPETTLGSTCYR